MPERKHKIIEAAKTSFSLYGYKGTTMDRIAKIAGVGKGTIYIFFENKEVLLNEIITGLVDEMNREADKAILGKETIREKHHAAIYALLMYRKEHELLIKLAREENDIGTEAVKKALQELETQIVDLISSRLTRAIKNGWIKECDPEITAFVMYKMYTALVYDWESKHSPLTDERISELFGLYLMDGLAVKK
ncbi:TetR/AcrR family transcriptional regulator [Paenibacillus turpanensis]|uniref:TetR/AcrR family transcriptional regulator n=1 Tax=Paenibacillus turpanensis TaxID=2689078 RepID=UPI001A9ED063|nr:TetR/AcrR family transcriptional regulator [Paenibacillus turpanensis]